MSSRFEELDWRETSMGAISLRRRTEPQLGVDVFEVKLDDDFLMSSLFTVAEVALARLGLAAVRADTDNRADNRADGLALDVVVGGLGLGYTATAALEDERVGSLTVLEALPEVVDWHRRGLLPESVRLTSDPRTRLEVGDFFSTVGVDERRFHAVLLDVDHSPRHVLHPSHEAFYTAEGLGRVRSRLRPGGAFALWSDDPPDEAFGAVLGDVFPRSEAHVVTFENHLTGGTSANTVYVASTG